MRKILLLSALAIGLAIFTIRADADEAVRSAQAQLQSAGYYTGPVDGQLNAETKAALRRYQIRNELEPSGELTPETTAALSKEQPSVPATPAATPIPPPLQPSVPTVPQPPSAARGIPVPSAEAEPDVYGGFYSRTPYAEAPREVKYSTLLKAQEILAGRGLYQGAINGLPGPATEEALIRFQAQRGLTRTGRLDLDTLAELHLLPVTKLRRARAVPGEYEPPVLPRGVRGIPLD